MKTKFFALGFGKGGAFVEVWRVEEGSSLMGKISGGVKG
jgi:hypothetical protein